MLATIVHAGAVLPSFELAARTLRLLADVSISGRHVGRLTETIGAELVIRRDAQAEAHRLRKRDAQVPNTPDVVVAEIDGGRYQCRAEGQVVPVVPARTFTQNGGRYQCRAEGQGCGAWPPQWREDKVACLVTLASTTHDTDPQPEPPECFLDRKHVGNVTQCSVAKEPEIAGVTDLSPVSSPERID